MTISGELPPLPLPLLGRRFSPLVTVPLFPLILGVVGCSSVMGSSAEERVQLTQRCSLLEARMILQGSLKCFKGTALLGLIIRIWEELR